MKKKGKKRMGKMSVVFVGLCLSFIIAAGLFCISLPLLNSASTAGNIVGVLSVFALVFCICKVVVIAAKKYKEASE